MSGAEEEGGAESRQQQQTQEQDTEEWTITRREPAGTKSARAKGKHDQGPSNTVREDGDEGQDKRGGRGRKSPDRVGRAERKGEGATNKGLAGAESQNALPGLEHPRLSGTQP